MSPHYQGTFNGGRDDNFSCMVQLRIDIRSAFGTCPFYRGIPRRGPDRSHRRMRPVTTWYIPDHRLPQATIDFPQGKIMHKTMGMFF
ncbi:hypothetical protein ACN42_g523 [Penicillium freii]|uniref:Uncharacterized protein n=1 Tax=Penicillium freii TaxID=48697 RepID=A0A117NSG9_PENFR|nr:hypothetical protein ACN42_g523 [Penicillium freii]